mmetsp:Transcript_4366/g.6424  ORF Transcript_4366/g.6424 Transcript_4366/m.6424 type:complete len:1605 (+) Transcript_4366:139-4953(+)|eukprot:CAMPEP_0117420818 /NCGR_PEP_ID=MMETSP0758-20121206/2078_1 /TAXON_ID=63605 /ORGANISM="Percolomonas cosmopolitus, Strain AE-1 (ATCC 50343)" /LENGTH=1604 /DNA_ID=CAMNT_0005202659 /DNA_START=49 /DNA_END=4863 /DNA_ORIENTATION=-
MTEIANVDFQFYTPSAVKNLSVGEVEIDGAFTSGSDNPIPGGIYDLKMGSFRRDQSCKTCHMGEDQCLGHYGHVDFPQHVVNPLVQGDLRKTLSAVCPICNTYRVNDKERFMFLQKLKLLEAHAITEAMQVFKSPMYFLRHTTKEDLTTKETISLNKWKKGDPIISTATNRDIMEDTDEESEEDLEDSDEEKSRKRKKASIMRIFKNWTTKVVTKLNSKQKRIIENEVNKVILKYTEASGCETVAAYMAKCRATANVHVAEERVKVMKEFIECAQGHSGCPRTGGSGKYNFILTVNKIAARRDPKFIHPPAKNPSFVIPDVIERKEDHIVYTPHLATLLSRTYQNEKDFINIAYRINTEEEYLSTFFMKSILIPPNRFRRPTLGSMKLLLPDGTSSLFIKIVRVVTEMREYHKNLNATYLEVDKGQQIEMKKHNLRLMTQIGYLMGVYMPLGAGTYLSFSAKEKLSRKKGIFRQNCMGKRVNYSARSVILPSLTCNTGEVQIPLVFAQKADFPEYVTAHNMSELMELIKRGPNVYPGCNAITFKNGNRKSLSRMTEEDRERISRKIDTKIMIVHRHLRDGDMCLLNRQPTLHRPSLLGQRIRVKVDDPETVIRFHYANCKSFNADFDGDEMNLHFPQNQLARAEAACVVHSIQNYIEPTRGEPIRGLIQDHIVAGVLLTKKDTFLDRETFMLYVFTAIERALGNRKIELVEPAILKPKQLWTGKQVITCILKNLARLVKFKLPHGVNFDSKTKLKGHLWKGHEEEGKVIVRDNHLLTGVLDKSQIGASAKGLVHCCHEFYGPVFADQLLSGISRLCTKFLQIHGFTCGLDDCLLTSEGDQYREKQLSQANEQCINDTYSFFSRGNEHLPIEEQNRLLSLVHGDERESKNLDATVKRALKKHQDPLTNNSVPDMQYKAFPKNHLTLMAESGAKGSRVNVTQIACCLGLQTYGGRRVQPDMGGKTLPSFRAFETSAMSGGFVGSRFLSGLQPPEFFFHCMAGRDGLNDTALKTAESGYLQRCLVKMLEELSVQYDFTVRDSFGSVIQFAYGGDGIDITKSSVSQHYEYLDMNAEAILSKYAHVLRSDANPENLVKEYESFQSPYLTKNDDRKGIDEHVLQRTENYINSHTTSHPKMLRAISRIQQLTCVLEPGEAIGVVAAQAVGEPSTQMTLNTFHQTGSDVVGVTQGIPRLRQLFMTGHVQTDVMQVESIVKEKILQHHIQVILNELSFSKVLKEYQVTETFVSNPGVIHQTISIDFDLDMLNKAYLFPMEHFKWAAVRLVEEIAIRCMDPERFKKLSRKLKSLSAVDEACHKIILRQSFQNLGVSYPTFTDDELKMKHYYTFLYGSSTNADEEEFMQDDSEENDSDADEDNQSAMSSQQKRTIAKNKGLLEHRRQIMSTMVLNSYDGIEFTDSGIRFVIQQHPFKKQSITPIIEQACRDVFLRKMKNVSVAQFVENELTIEGKNMNFILDYRLGRVLNEFRLKSNNISIIENLYGIEAAYKHLFDEAYHVFDSYGQDVNPRHISLISDQMTYAGTYRSCNRFSIMKYRPSPFATASFETPTMFIKRACELRSADTVVTPSSKMILGGVVNQGTGSFELRQMIQ